jgi:hypothetical protein
LFVSTLSQRSLNSSQSLRASSLRDATAAPDSAGSLLHQEEKRQSTVSPPPQMPPRWEQAASTFAARSFGPVLSASERERLEVELSVYRTPLHWRPPMMSVAAARHMLTSALSSSASAVPERKQPQSAAGVPLPLLDRLVAIFSHLEQLERPFATAAAAAAPAPAPDAEATARPRSANSKRRIGSAHPLFAPTRRQQRGVRSRPALALLRAALRVNPHLATFVEEVERDPGSLGIGQLTRWLSGWMALLSGGDVAARAAAADFAAKVSAQISERRARDNLAHKAWLARMRKASALEDSDEILVAREKRRIRAEQRRRAMGIESDELTLDFDEVSDNDESELQQQ